MEGEGGKARGEFGAGEWPRQSGQLDLAKVPDFTIGPIEIMPSSRQIVCGGQGRTIEPRVMQVLVVMGHRSNGVVSRDELVNICWGGLSVSDDAINRTVAKLRQIAVETDAFEIETIARVGYRLREKAAAVAKRRYGWRLGRRGWLAAGLALVLVAALAAVLLRGDGVADAQRPKVAVLGFTSLNAGTEAQHYADSITTAVSDALVTVGARVQASPRDGSKVTTEEARRAGAAFLISGTVRREGPLIRVTARIDPAQRGGTLISREFDVPAREAATVPDRVAASVADTVGSWGWILRHERDPDRIAALIRVQASWYEDVVHAYRLSRELAEAAPSSGPAQMAFASTTGYAVSRLPLSERKEAVEAARISARRARALMANDGDVYALDCMLKPPGRAILTSECDERMRQGMAVDRDAYFLPMWYTDLLIESGRYVAAERVSRKALTVAPFSPNRIALRLQALWMMAGRSHFAGEIAELEQSAVRY